MDNKAVPELIADKDATGTFEIPVKWETRSTLTVQAHSLKDAIEYTIKAAKQGEFKLPSRGKEFESTLVFDPNDFLYDIEDARAYQTEYFDKIPVCLTFEYTPHSTVFAKAMFGCGVYEGNGKWEDRTYQVALVKKQDGSTNVICENEYYDVSDTLEKPENMIKAMQDVVAVYMMEEEK